MLQTTFFFKDIDSADDLLSLEEDIEKFSITDICEAEVDKEATSAALERIRSSSSTTQCSAWCNYQRMKQHRCSAVASKSSDFCSRHNERVRSGKGDEKDTATDRE